MFLRISIFALFLTSFQLQAADLKFDFKFCTKKTYFEKIALEVALCSPDLPQELVKIISGHIEENMTIVDLAPACIMIFKGRIKIKPRTLSA
jgi:hypothetical protein